jgi:hypothetical protein
VGYEIEAMASAAGFERRPDLRLIALMVLLAVWTIAVGTVGVLILVAAGRAGQVIFVAHQTAVVGRPTTVTLHWFQLHPAVELLTVGLALVCIVGAVALAGRGLSRRAWLKRLALVMLGFAAVVQSDAPVAGRWWEPAPGQLAGRNAAQNAAQNAALGHWWVHEHQASGILLLIAAAIGAYLLAMTAQVSRAGAVVPTTRS